MNKKPAIFGLVLVALGLILLLKSMGIHIFSFVWPVALIVLGLWLIYRRRHQDPPPGATIHEGVPPGYGQSATGSTSHQQSTSWTYEIPVRDEPGRIKYQKFIGDMYIDCSNINLQKIEVSTFLGDVQVNLSGGKLAPGLNRMIISSFIGDTQVFVPKGMPVFVHCSGFAGDVDALGRRTSGFGNTMDAQTDNYASAEAKLYIAVNMFIGDIRVYAV